MLTPLCWTPPRRQTVRPWHCHARLVQNQHGCCCVGGQVCSTRTLKGRGTCPRVTTSQSCAGCVPCIIVSHCSKLGTELAPRCYWLNNADISKKSHQCSWDTGYHNCSMAVQPSRVSACKSQTVCRYILCCCVPGYSHTQKTELYSCSSRAKALYHAVTACIVPCCHSLL